MVGINPFDVEDKAMPHFTKKHYDALAQVLKNSSTKISELPGDTTDIQLGLSVAVSAMITLFAEDNPRFNKAAFIAAITKE